MPLTASAPETLTTPGTVIGQVNYFEVVGFGYDNPVGGNPHLAIRWAAGFQDPTSGAITWLVERVSVLQGAPLRTAVSALVTPGNTRFQEIKLALYGALQQLGVWPAGTVS